MNKTITPPQDSKHHISFFLALIIIGITLIVIQPSKASAETLEPEDGLYFIEYTADTRWSLDINQASSVQSPVTLNQTNASAAQYLLVEKQDNDWYRLTTFCGTKSSMAYDASGPLVENRNTLIQKKWDGSDSQLWRFILNENNSVSIYPKSNESLCINLKQDNRSPKATIQLYPWSNNDIASQWSLVKKAVSSNAHTTTIEDDKTFVFPQNSQTIYLTNLQDSSAHIIEKPDGFYESYDENGVLSKSTYENGFYKGNGIFKIQYDTIGYYQNRPIQAIVTVSNISSDNPKPYNRSGVGVIENTTLDFQWVSGNWGSSGSGKATFFDGFCIMNSSSYDLTYSLSYADTGEPLSLSGSYMSITSLNGDLPQYDGDTASYEGVAYEYNDYQTFVLQTNNLKEYLPGIYFGDSNNFTDVVGSETFTKNAVAFLIEDETPTFTIFSMVQGNGAASWSAPNLSPLTILEPNQPVKNVSITN